MKGVQNVGAVANVAVRLGVSFCLLSWCRMFENKMKELENELSQKTSRLSELKLQLKAMNEREERAQTRVQQLQDQVGVRLQITVITRIRKQLGAWSRA